MKTPILEKKHVKLIQLTHPLKFNITSIIGAKKKKTMQTYFNLLFAWHPHHKEKEEKINMALNFAIFTRNGSNTLLRTIGKKEKGKIIMLV